MHCEGLTQERLDEIIDNSFKNFHVKGFDYICVQRSSELTQKYYFFDGDISHLPEVVSPHDHRYNFSTQVIVGTMSNSVYGELPIDSKTNGIVYQEFEWNTPLNGGDGFSWNRETRLFERERIAYGKDHITDGHTYWMGAKGLHTIRMHSDQCIIKLNQFEDVIPVGVPTKTFMLTTEAPSLDGLYERFTYDEVIARIRTLTELGERMPWQMDG